MCVRLNEQQCDHEDCRDQDRSPSPALPSHRRRDEPDEIEDDRDDEEELQKDVQRFHTIRTYPRTGAVPRNASKRKRRPKAAFELPQIASAQSVVKIGLVRVTVCRSARATASASSRRIASRRSASAARYASGDTTAEALIAGLPSVARTRRTCTRTPSGPISPTAKSLPRVTGIDGCSTMARARSVGSLHPPELSRSMRDIVFLPSVVTSKGSDSGRMCATSFVMFAFICSANHARYAGSIARCSGRPWFPTTAEAPERAVTSASLRKKRAPMRWFSTSFSSRTA